MAEKKEAKRKKMQEPKKEEKGKKMLTLPAHLEAMYAKPKKGAATATTTTTTLTATLPPLMLQQGHGKARCQTPNSPENSYMSVRVGFDNALEATFQPSLQARGRQGKGRRLKRALVSFWGRADVKRYAGSLLVVLLLSCMLGLGLYFMTGNVVTISKERRPPIFFPPSSPSSSTSSFSSDTWRDFEKINWGTGSVGRTENRSSGISRSAKVGRSDLGVEEGAAWSQWTKWTRSADFSLELFPLLP